MMTKFLIKKTASSKETDIVKTYYRTKYTSGVNLDVEKEFAFDSYEECSNYLSDIVAFYDSKCNHNLDIKYEIIEVNC